MKNIVFSGGFGLINLEHCAIIGGGNISEVHRINPTTTTTFYQSTGQTYKIRQEGKVAPLMKMK